ncbi:MAG: hypothetical protein ABIQ60_09600, partial [Burkholderiaceae bacterium]
MLSACGKKEEPVAQAPAPAPVAATAPASEPVATTAAAPSGNEATAQKWIDSEFQPSTLSKEQQLDEMKWFIAAAAKL